MEAKHSVVILVVETLKFLIGDLVIGGFVYLLCQSLASGLTAGANTKLWRIK